MPSSQKGFTLIEILLVLVFLTIVTAVTVPRFSQSFAQLQLQDATNDIAYLMRYAQSRAIHTRRALKLMFDDQRGSYWLQQATQEEDEAEDPESTSYEAVPGRFGRTVKIPEGMKVESEISSVAFTPDGRIEKTQINVCQGEKCLIVSTQHQSGYVLVAPAEESP